MAIAEVAYLGPAGTYSHLVASKRYGRNCKLVPLPTITDVCFYVSGKPSKHAIVPIENSSGGAIYEIVDILLANKPPVHIVEELTIEVMLALLGHKGERIRTLYSHFAPLEHCDTWLRRHLPKVERHVVTSTAIAAQRASSEQSASALGSRRLARIYNLNVIHYPVEAAVPNITVFIAIGGKRKPIPGSSKTTLAVKLPNRPGSLCAFLEPFKDEKVNLSRLISRPIRGCPREYAFLVDIEGATHTPKVKRALAIAAKSCAQLRVVGSYPARRPYKS